MQITLNKVPFDVRPVEAAVRTAVLSEPGIRQAMARAVWAWDREERRGRYLVPTTPDKALPLPLGLAAFVPKAGTPEGAALQKAEGPSAKMVERILAAVGAKKWESVMQAVARVTGVPQKKIPFDAFALLNDRSSYQIRMNTELQVVELANPGRNLSAYALLPGLVSFVAALPERIEGLDLPQRPMFALPAATQAALTMRRLAVARRLNEMQAELGGARPADLEPTDPRRIEIAKLGAEWKALQPKSAPKAA